MIRYSHYMSYCSSWGATLLACRPQRSQVWGFQIPPELFNTWLWKMGFPCVFPCFFVFDPGWRNCHHHGLSGDWIASKRNWIAWRRPEVSAALLLKSRKILRLAVVESGLHRTPDFCNTCFWKNMWRPHCDATAMLGIGFVPKMVEHFRWVKCCWFVDNGCTNYNSHQLLIRTSMNVIIGESYIIYIYASCLEENDWWEL